MALPGIVYVGEDSSGDDFSLWSGRWSAHWEPRPGSPDSPREGPHGVSASEAIAWGRDQADIVLIRPGDSDTHYSAGRRHRKNVPVWPEGKELPRRRDPRLAYRDRPDGSLDIAWRVRHGLKLPIPGLSDFIEAYATSLGRDGEIEKVLESVQLNERGNAEGAFVVRAATAGDARAKAAGATTRAWKAACDSVATLEAPWSSFISDPEPTEDPSQRATGCDLIPGLGELL